MLFEEPELPDTSWRSAAREWFSTYVDNIATTRLPCVQIDGVLVATAIGTLEIGVPNPMCPTGRVVRLSNLITLPAHRKNGHGTALVRDVIGWAQATVAADRVDLSATPDGRRLYEQLGFVNTSAPRMKLVL